MIRCYEAKLSEKLDPVIKDFLVRDWISEINSYGIDLKRYVIIQELDKEATLGFYVLNSDLFRDKILIDRYFSESLIKKPLIMKGRNSPIYLSKRRILKFFPIDYNEEISIRKLYSGLTRVILNKKIENCPTIIGVIYSSIYQVRSEYEDLLGKIWTLKKEGKYSKVIPEGILEI